MSASNRIKTKRLFLMLVLISSVIYGQDTSKKETRDFKRISIGVNFSSDYCFRTLINHDGSDFSNNIIGMFNQIDKPKFGFTSGFSFCFNFTKHFGIEAGVQYSNKGFQSKETALTFGNLVDRRRGFVYNTSGLPTSGKFVYTYHYIDIPLKLNFLVGKKKLRFISSVGLTANLFLTEVSSFVGKDANGNSFHNSSTNNSINRFNFSPTISAGIDWKISNSTNLRIEPIFRYGVVPLLDAPVSEYLWSGGLNISYYFGL